MSPQTASAMPRPQPLQAAQVAQAAERAALSLVMPVDPVQLALHGFLARYKPRTRATYAHHLRRYLAWLSEHGQHPFEVRRAHLELYLRHLEEAGLKSATRNSRFGVIHLFYRYAVLDELVLRDPTDHVTRPKIHRGEQRRTWLPHTDFLRLLEAARAAGPEDHVLIVLLGIVAMRVGEVCSLNCGDVAQRGGWWTVTFVGKGGDTYTEVIPPAAVEDLLVIVDGVEPGEPLLVSERGTRMERRSAATVLARLCRAAGIKRDITPHGLRRTAATVMLQQGVSPRAVQRKLRHASLETTMIYDRAEVTLDQSAALPFAASLYSSLTG